MSDKKNFNLIEAYSFSFFFLRRRYYPERNRGFLLTRRFPPVAFFALGC